MFVCVKCINFITEIFLYVDQFNFPQEADMCQKDVAKEIAYFYKEIKHAT